MSKNEIVAQIEALNEWESVIAEAQAEAEAIRDSIKAEMLDRDAEELQAGKYIVRWTPVLSNRFDSTSFKSSTGNCTKPSSNKSAAADSQSAHENSPLPECRPKPQARD